MVELHESVGQLARDGFGLRRVEGNFGHADSIVRINRTTDIRLCTLSPCIIKNRRYKFPNVQQDTNHLPHPHPPRLRPQSLANLLAPCTTPSNSPSPILTPSPSKTSTAALQQ